MSVNKKKTTQVWLHIMILTFLVFSIYLFLTYLRYSTSKSDSIKIEYTVSVIKENNGGRGSYYTSEIDYNNKAYDISITSSVYDSMLLGFKPVVYYNAHHDIAFTDWDISSRKRGSVVSFSITLIVVMIVYGKRITSIFSQIDVK